MNPICVMIFGPGAVGKMAVGKTLADKTGLKLFHNHMSIELLVQIFPHDSPQFKKLDKEIRMGIFKEMASSDQRGIIFTFVFALDDENDWKYTEEIMDIFKENGSDCFFVELEASQDTRLMRDRTPLRLSEKPSKKDFSFSQKGVISMDEKYKLNTLPNERELMQRRLGNFMKINNENLSPDAVATIIIETFNLDTIDHDT